MRVEDLLAPVDEDFDVEEALEAWRWLVPQPVKPLFVTALGDLFLAGESGAVFLLDTIDGKCEEVAASVQEWEGKLREPRLLEEWFMPAFVSELREAGVQLPPGHCYSATHSIVLGGSFAVENWQPTHWRPHFWVLGQIHQQVKDLPPGTKITKINFTPL
jgi:hypothetical protein